MELTIDGTPYHFNPPLLVEKGKRARTMEQIGESRVKVMIEGLKPVIVPGDLRDVSKITNLKWGELIWMVENGKRVSNNWRWTKENVYERCDV